jgi:hypothetical protein
VPGGKPSEASGASLDGKVSEVSKAPEAPKAAEASGAGPDGKPSEVAKVGVPLTALN